MDFNELVDERLERADLVKVRCYDCDAEVFSGGTSLVGLGILCQACAKTRQRLGLELHPERLRA